MAYLVYARKWRPQAFDEVVGQEHVTQTLKNSLKNNTLAHAYLFVGPRGVGKTSCARILAKSLNCKDAPTLQPCGTCSACVEISQGRSLDVIEIDGASNRGIDEIRTLRENVKFSPVSGNYKIYIIDEVHMLTQEAFNALLKTLEEPPEHVKFIFATTRPDKVLATIVSRCQRFEFNRIPTLKIIEKLEEVCKAEKITVDKTALFNIAKISDGSMRDAESVLDQLVSFSKNKIKAEDVIEVMGLIGQDSYFEFVQALKDKKTQACIDFIATLFNRGKDIAKFLEGFLWHMRNLMLAKIMKSDLGDLLDLPPEIVGRISEQSAHLSLGEIMNMFNAVLNAQDMARKINSFRIPLEIMAVKLTQPSVDAPSAAVVSAQRPASSHEASAASEPALSAQGKKFSSKIKLDNIGSLFIGTKKEKKEPEKTVPEKHAVETAADNKEIPESAQAPGMQEPHAADSGASFDDILNNWHLVVEEVARQKISVGTYLRESTPVSLKDGVLTIGFPKRAVFYKEAVEQRHNQTLLRDQIKITFNTMLNLKLEFLKDVTEKEKTDDGESTYLKSVINTFNGRVFEQGA